MVEKAFTRVGPRARLLTIAVALVLALTLFGALPQAAQARAAYPTSAACSANYPAGNYPSGFGATLSSINLGHSVPACSNGTQGYWSNVTSSSWLGVPFQCTEFIRRWAYFQYGNSPTSWANGYGGGDGNAANMWWAHPGGWYTHGNGTSHMPQVGDIIVWGPVTNGNPDESKTLNTPGHVAVILSVSTVSSTKWNVTAIQQNIGTGYGTPANFSNTSGTIGKYDVPAVYVLSMNESVGGSQIYGVVSRS